MSRLIFTLLVVALFSCTKSSVTQFDPNRAYTIKYKAEDQVVKTSVRNDTLRLNFYQKVNFLLDPDEHRNSWALHLIQDFSSSYLNKLDFNMVASAAGYAHNWVPINLNDVHPDQKTISNVTVEGKPYVQVSLNRLFEFYSVLNNNEAATNMQNTLLQTGSHTVTYKAFYSSNNQYSVSSDQNFRLVYTR